VQNGHFVGSDGFIVPRNFTEFSEKFPNYTFRWVQNNLKPPLVRSKDDVLDWASDLNQHLMTISAKKRKAGKVDVIDCFDPVAACGATQAKFLYFVDVCLKRRFVSILRHLRTDALNGHTRSETNISLQEQAGTSDSQTVEEQIYSLSELHTIPDQAADYRDKKDFIDGFRAFAGIHDPYIVQFMELVGTRGTYQEVIRRPHYSEYKFANDRLRMKELMDCYQTGEAPRPQRRRARF
jgi:hypothetical protein